MDARRRTYRSGFQPSYSADHIHGASPHAGIDSAFGALPHLTTAEAPATRPIPPWKAPTAHPIQAPTAHPIQAQIAHPIQAPTARTIPAWGEAPCMASRTRQGLKARPITCSIPNVAFVAFHAIFLQECAHFLLEILLRMVRLLAVDVTDQSVRIRRSNGERAIASLPCESRQAWRLSLEPFRRRRFKLSHQVRHGSRAGQTNRQMDVVRNAPGTIAFAVRVTRHSSEIGVERRAHGGVEHRFAIFRAEDHMHKEKGEGLRHDGNYRSGFQPSRVVNHGAWGCAPCWYWIAPTALSLTTHGAAPSALSN